MSNSQNGSGGAYTQAANGMQQAGQAAQGVAGYQPLTGAGATAAMNPYTSNVIDTSMGDLNRARQMSMNDVGAQATAAGAFGGSRHGVAEGVTNTGFANTAATMASGLRRDAFTNAQDTNLAAAQMRLQGAQGLGTLATTGFNVANTVNGMQSGYGNQQQGNAQQLINSIAGQWQGYTGAPGQALTQGAGVLGSVPYGQTSTQKYNPGLFDWVSLGVSALPGGGR